MGQLEVLNHEPTLKGFISKLPSKACLDRYIAMKEDLKPENKSALEILAAFMTKERQTQKQHEEFARTGKGASRDLDAKV